MKGTFDVATIELDDSNDDDNTDSGDDQDNFLEVEDEEFQDDEGGEEEEEEGVTELKYDENESKLEEGEEEEEEEDSSSLTTEEEELLLKCLSQHLNAKPKTRKKRKFVHRRFQHQEIQSLSNARSIFFDHLSKEISRGLDIESFMNLEKEMNACWRRIIQVTEGERLKFEELEKNQGKEEVLKNLDKVESTTDNQIKTEEKEEDSDSKILINIPSLEEIEEIEEGDSGIIDHVEKTEKEYRIDMMKEENIFHHNTMANLADITIDHFKRRFISLSKLNDLYHELRSPQSQEGGLESNIFEFEMVNPEDDDDENNDLIASHLMLKNNQSGISTTSSSQQEINQENEDNNNLVFKVMKEGKGLHSLSENLMNFRYDTEEELKERIQSLHSMVEKVRFFSKIKTFLMRFYHTFLSIF